MFSTHFNKFDESSDYIISMSDFMRKYQKITESLEEIEYNI